MRIIVFGLGAVGGVIAGALAHSGQEVIAIGRGAMLNAVQDNGLRLRSPDFDERVALAAVAAPSEIDFRADDAILLCMKSQDTEAALHALRDAGVTDQPIFCVQNGVANERMALRLFANVHGVTVMMPCTYVTPGEVISRMTPRFGIFDIGRCPRGVDQADSDICAQLDAANFGAFAQEDVMPRKYGKLLMNLSNVTEAAFGPDGRHSDLAQRLRTEAETVLAAARIEWHDVGASDPRRGTLSRFGDVAGAEYQGGSTLQSLMRGGSVETDYMNGEISLLGRLHGTPSPLNDAMTRLGAWLARDGIAPGTLDEGTVLRELGLG
jgi:2-dehydropantoate 2-reductase